MVINVEILATLVLCRDREQSVDWKVFFRFQVYFQPEVENVIFKLCSPIYLAMLLIIVVFILFQNVIMYIAKAYHVRVV